MSMAPPHTAVDLDPATSIWADVGERLESFARAWDSATTPPAIYEHLPAHGSTVLKLILVELIKVDIDRRLQRGLDKPLEFYLQEFPDLADKSLPSDLVYEDYHLRRQAGRPVDHADYLRRFPTSANVLARLFDGNISDHSTAVLAASPHVEIESGASIDDFDLLALLGEGQFARVFLARQRSMQRLVALKISAARGAEAQTLAQLEHPHIVRVYDQRLLDEPNVQLVYMSYLPGGTLQNVLQKVRSTPAGQQTGKTLLDAVDAALDARGETPPPASPVRAEWAARSWPATICTLGVKLAGALDYAHRRGVLHRDIKPANVLLTQEAEPLLADFNVGSCSKLDGTGPAAIFGGSLPYMSPEHLEAFNPAHPRSPDSLDGRSDIFSLAVTMWELLAGERPYRQDLRSNDWQEMLNELIEFRRMGPSPEGIKAVVEGDVPGLRDLLLRCLEFDANRRPATAAEMASELALCLRPATRDLLRPAPGGWRGFVRRHPYWTLLIAGLIPNSFASLFNILYNGPEIIDPWGRSAKHVFESVIPPINAIFYVLAVIVATIAFFPIAAALRRVRAGAALDARTHERARRRALRFGQIGAMICTGTWAIAGLAWPIVLRIMAGPPQQGVEAYVHFLVSLVLCGLIAAAYPYFLITFVAIRVWYPSLLGSRGPVAADQLELDRVTRELSRYRAAATAVPLFAVALLASLRASEPIPVALLSVIGLAGTALAFVLEGRTRSDLAALSAAPLSGTS